MGELTASGVKAPDDPTRQQILERVRAWIDDAYLLLLQALEIRNNIPYDIEREIREWDIKSPGYGWLRWVWFAVPPYHVTITSITQTATVRWRVRENYIRQCADALLALLRHLPQELAAIQVEQKGEKPESSPTVPSGADANGWLTVTEAALIATCNSGVISNAVKAASSRAMAETGAFAALTPRTYPAGNWNEPHGQNPPRARTPYRKRWIKRRRSRRAGTADSAALLLREDFFRPCLANGRGLFRCAVAYQACLWCIVWPHYAPCMTAITAQRDAEVWHERQQQDQAGFGTARRTRGRTFYRLSSTFAIARQLRKAGR
jgi:hypothetical protein